MERDDRALLCGRDGKVLDQDVAHTIGIVGVPVVRPGGNNADPVHMVNLGLDVADREPVDFCVAWQVVRGHVGIGRTPAIAIAEKEDTTAPQGPVDLSSC